MRIAMLTNNYKPYIGGVPVSIEHLAEALRGEGHEVYVFAPSYEGQVEEEFVVRYPSFPIKVAGAPVPNILTHLFVRKMMELQIDVIHVHHPAIVGNVALLLKKRLGLPVVFTYHTRYEQYLHYIKPLEQFERRVEFVDKYLDYFCKQCDLILAPTPGIKKYLESKNLNTPIGVLPTGIPKEGFCPNKEWVEQIRSQYKSDVDYLFCTTSRLAKEKNLDYQLEELALLKENLTKQKKSFRHLMIGDGPQRQELEHKAVALGLEKNIVFLGNVEQTKICNLVSAADAFLFTSKSETQGIVILEAMATMTPVIAVKAIGVEDVVRDGENGFLVKEEKGSFCTAVQQYLEQEEIHQSLEEGAFYTAEQFKESEIARMAESFYFHIRLQNVQTEEISFGKRLVL